LVKPYWVTQSHSAVPKVTAALAGGTHESESHASRQAQEVTTPEAKPNGHTTFTMVSKVVQCGGNHVHSVANGPKPEYLDGPLARSHSIFDGIYIDKAEAVSGLYMFTPAWRKLQSGCAFCNHIWNMESNIIKP